MHNIKYCEVMMSRRSKYDAEFKKNAIALSVEKGQSNSKVEKSLGLSQGQISRWKNQLEKEGDLAFPGNGREALTEEQKRIRALEAELKETALERDILKKAIAIFSKAPK